jgi:hypothetical protein
VLFRSADDRQERNDRRRHERGGRTGDERPPQPVHGVDILEPPLDVVARLIVADRRERGRGGKADELEHSMILRSDRD